MVEEQAGHSHRQRTATLAGPAVEDEGVVVFLPRGVRGQVAEEQLLDGVVLLNDDDRQSSSQLPTQQEW